MAALCRPYSAPERTPEMLLKIFWTRTWRTKGRFDEAKASAKFAANFHKMRAQLRAQLIDPI